MTVHGRPEGERPQNTLGVATEMTEFDGGALKTLLGRMRAFQQSLPTQ